MEALGEMWDYLTTADNWWGPSGILALTWAHVKISVTALVIAAVVAIPPAVVLGHVRRGGTLSVAMVNLGRALPSFGILALALPISIELGLGLGFWPTLVPLVILGIPPIFANSYTGVRTVTPSVVESARGMGLRPRQVLLDVELPIAVPLVLTGLRVSAVQIVATATLGALVGFQCLGSLVVQGIAQFDDGKTLTGGLLVALLAILTEIAFSATERALTPWQRRRGARMGFRRSVLEDTDNSGDQVEVAA
jgi:osmoprotectant transport system permease protein